MFKLFTIPLSVMIFMLSAGIFILRDTKKFEQILHISALVAVFSAVCALVDHYFRLLFLDGAVRLSGYGILYNPLLTAHVYGGFVIYWLVHWVLSDKFWKPVPIVCLSILGLLLVQTGSKTPFVGLGFALLWLLALTRSRRVLFSIMITGLLTIIQYIWAVINDVWSGASCRPEIWMETLKQIYHAPWFGHGYDAPISIDVSIGTFSDQHNIELAVLYEGGVTGLVFWMIIYICALQVSWRFRQNSLVLIASTWLVFGLGSGLTEGSSFLPRPKEHWFLIWIPLALLFASNVLLLNTKRQDDAIPEKT